MTCGSDQELPATVCSRTMSSLPRATHTVVPLADSSATTWLPHVVPGGPLAGVLPAVLVEADDPVDWTAPVVVGLALVGLALVSAVGVPAAQAPIEAARARLTSVRATRVRATRVLAINRGLLVAGFGPARRSV
jgi:hypothetical protein